MEQLTFYLNISGKRVRVVVQVQKMQPQQGDSRPEHPSVLLVRSPYIPQLLEELRAFWGSKWDPDSKLWKIPLTERNQYNLRALQGEYDDHYNPKPLPLDIKTPAHFFSHQTDIFNFIITYRRVLIAGEMGIGKTLPVIHFIHMAHRLGWVGQCLIVAPKSALMEWMRQIYEWDYKSILDYVRFTTYESLKNFRSPEDYSALILDECVKIKTPTAQRSHEAMRFSDGIRLRQGFIVGLSGSPAPKNPTDWWHQIEVLQPGYIREGSSTKLGYRLGKWDYSAEYPRLEYWHPGAIKSFARRIRPICLPIRKSDVFDFPAKIFTTRFIKPTDEWMSAAKSLAHFEPRTMVLISKLRQLSDGFMYKHPESEEFIICDDSPKEKQLAIDLEHFSDSESPRIVIAGAFDETLKKIKSVCDSCGWNTGVFSGSGRPHIQFLDIFASDSDQRIAAIVHPACVYGLNFSKSPAIIIYSNTFNADDRIQLLERCDRPGKEGGGTQIIDYIHLPTDQLVLDNANGKIKLQAMTINHIKEAL